MSAAEFTPIAEFGPVPAGWIWGAATAAHQIEGGNTNNDWWVWEHQDGTRAAESSGDACDSWHRWREDLQLAKKLGLDSYRFSIEWSRIEPAPGEFSNAALDHYLEMMVAAHDLGLKNCVSFHHFTTPAWLLTDGKGAWEHPEIAERFARFCEVAVARLGERVDMACTINELNVPGFVGYMMGDFTPGKVQDAAAFAQVQHNYVAAHEAARDVLRAGPGDFPVGMTLALADLQFHDSYEWDSPSRGMDAAPTEGPQADFMKLMGLIQLESAKDDDFLGLQTYFTQHFGPDGQALPIPDDVRKTSIGWAFTPEALGVTARRVSEVLPDMPIYITENGVATDDDAERIEYFSRSLTALRGAMDDGADVRGFFAWSLLDNFEWAEGFKQRFGMVDVDLETFERTPKPSYDWYRGIIASTR